jgi:hypothetical protein
MSVLFQSCTRIGRVVFAVGMTALLVGFAAGWSELMVIGIGCLLAVLTGALWILRPQHIAVSRTLHPARVTVGESAIGVIGVTNSTRVRIGKQLVEDRLGDASVRMELPSLAPGEVFEQLYTVPSR